MSAPGSPFRVTVRAIDLDSPGAAARVVAQELPVGRPMTFGREGDVPVGVDLDDPGISRVALTVTPTESGWDVSFENSNGCVLCPWAQAPASVHKGERRVVRWPQVAVMVLGARRSLQHWVLLETRMFAGPEPTVAENGPLAVTTELAGRPKPLTAAQRDALTTVFAEHLAWPPRLPARPLKQDAAGRRLNINASAVQQRLEGALARARDLGLSGQIDLTQPDYLYLLVSHGYLSPPAASI